MEPVITGSVQVYPDSARLVLIVFGLLLSVISFWVAIDRIGSSQRKSAPPDNTSEPCPPIAEDEWNVLCARAGSVVEQAISELPPEVADIANKIPCLFETHAENESPGYRKMGIFRHFTPGKVSSYSGPIVLYLKTIEEVCANSGRLFEDQVRETYLHELGHGLGWDEIDLIRHGLPSGKALDQLMGKRPASPS